MLNNCEHRKFQRPRADSSSRGKEAAPSRRLRHAELACKRPHRCHPRRQMQDPSRVAALQRRPLAGAAKSALRGGEFKVPAAAREALQELILTGPEVDGGAEVGE